MADSPTSYTTYHTLSKWDNHADPGAAGLNSNWDKIDSVLHGLLTASAGSVTSSYATTAKSSSYALSGSYSLSGSYVLTAKSSSYSLSGSYALTASYYGKVNPATMNTQSVTVSASLTAPIPSYIGQPGLNSGSIPYVATSLTNTTWKRLTAFNDNIGNYNLNTNYRWKNGLADNSKLSAWLYNEPDPQIEESNSVFDYKGRCVKGIKSSNSHGVHIENFTLSDVPFDKLLIKYEFYLPAATGFTLYVYANPTGSLIETKAFSTQGVNVYERLLDISSYTNLTQIYFYYVSPYGDTANVRVGRVYVGDNLQGNLDGTNQKTNYVVSSSLQQFRSSYPIASDYVIATRDRYVQTEEKLDNEIYSLFENDKIKYIDKSPANEYPFIATASLSSSFSLPFSKAVNIYFTSSIVANSYPGFVYKTKFRPTFNVSSWVRVADTVGNTYGMKIETVQGINDTVIKTLRPTIVFNSTNYNLIKSYIDSGSYFESASTDFTIRSRGYITYESQEYFHIECEVTNSLSETDYMKISFGDLYRLWGAGTTPNFYVFGMQLFDSGSINKFYGEANYKSLYSDTIDTYRNLNKNSSYDYDNVIVDFFNNGGKLYGNDGSSSTIYHNGYFETYDGIDITKVESDKFHEGYKLTYVSGALPKYQNIFTTSILIDYNLPSYITKTQESSSCLGFWIDRRELSGSGIIFSDNTGATWILNIADLCSKGFRESRTISGSTPVIYYEVDQIDGNYSHLKFNIYNSYYAAGDRHVWRLQITGSTNNVNSLTLYNPTLIYTTSLDPYYRYHSLAEKNNSIWIGKNATYVGDSEFNDQIMACELSRQFGFNVYDSHRGGHAMKYINSASWFYDYAKRDIVLGFESISLFIMAASSNDSFGGGSSSYAHVQQVLDSYPVYGDDTASVASKLAIFAAMSESQKQDIFNYKATYSAYLKQILDNHRDTRIIITSVPISCGGYLTGTTGSDGYGQWISGSNADTVRAYFDSGYQTKRNDILELRDKYQLNFCDLMNEVGLTYENFLRYCVDGTHWTDEIDYRIAYSIVQEIKKLYY